MSAHQTDRVISVVKGLPRDLCVGTQDLDCRYRNLRLLVLTNLDRLRFGGIVNCQLIGLTYHHGLRNRRNTVRRHVRLQERGKVPRAESGREGEAEYDRKLGKKECFH